MTPINDPVAASEAYTPPAALKEVASFALPACMTPTNDPVAASEACTPPAAVKVVASFALHASIQQQISRCWD